MKHVTYAQKSLLFGDETADALLEYAAVLAADGSADTVQVHAYDSDGDEVLATFVLSDGIELMAETTRSSIPEPDNTEILAYLRERLANRNTTRDGGRVVSRPTATAEASDLDYLDQY